LEFYNNKNNFLKNKILYLETVYEVFKEHSKNNSNIISKEIINSIEENKLSVELNNLDNNYPYINLYNNLKNQTDKAKENPENIRDHIILEIDSLIKKCEENFKDLDFSKNKTKTNINESIFYDKNSYYIPNVNSNNINNPCDNSFMNTVIINRNYSIIENDMNFNMTQNEMNFNMTQYDYYYVLKEKFFEYQKNLELIKNNLLKEKELEIKKNSKEIKLKSLKINISEQKRKLDELINK